MISFRFSTVLPPGRAYQVVPEYNTEYLTIFLIFPTEKPCGNTKFNSAMDYTLRSTELQVH